MASDPDLGALWPRRDGPGKETVGGSRVDKGGSKLLGNPD